MNKEEELAGSKAEMTFGQCRALLPAAACCDTSLQGARQSIAETTTGDELIVCASSAKVRRLSTAAAAAADVASRQTALALMME